MGPLADVTIVDFSENLPGPYATRILADLGAGVVKVERPGGDPARALFPGLFAAINRGKTCVTVDLKSERGRSEIQDLVSSADIVVEGFRPGVADRIGIGYADLSIRNPGLVYASISGYGQTSAERDAPGHDLNYLAHTGGLAFSGGSTANLPVGDLAGAMFAVTAILAALRTREQTGGGQYLDISITSALSHWLLPRYAAMAAGEFTDAAELATRPAYGVFAAADGKKIALAAMEDHFWLRLVAMAGFEDLRNPGFDTWAGRKKQAATIQSKLAAVFATSTAEDWIMRLAREDIPANLVNDPRTVLDAAQPDDVISLRDGLMHSRFPVAMSSLNNGDGSTCN